MVEFLKAQVTDVLEIRLRLVELLMTQVTDVLEIRLRAVEFSMSYVIQILDTTKPGKTTRSRMSAAR